MLEWGHSTKEESVIRHHTKFHTLPRHIQLFIICSYQTETGLK
jgi:hypothetical protein